MFLKYSYFNSRAVGRYENSYLDRYTDPRNLQNETMTSRIFRF